MTKAWHIELGLHIYILCVHLLKLLPYMRGYSTHMLNPSFDLGMKEINASL